VLCNRKVSYQDTRYVVRPEPKKKKKPWAWDTDKCVAILQLARHRVVCRVAQEKKKPWAWDRQVAMYFTGV